MHNDRRPNGMTVEHRRAGPDAPALEIHRSWRRQRSATVDFRNGRLIARLPAGLMPEAEERLLNDLIPKALKRDRARQYAGDAELLRRACQLADRYLDGVRPVSVTWSARMGRRWGSCTPAARTIRISDALAGMPDYVMDYLLVHELAHLRERRHNATFQRLVGRYPERHKAQGYLDGFLHGQRAAAVTHALACGRGPNEPANRPLGSAHDAAGPDAVSDYDLSPEPSASDSSPSSWSLEACGVDPDAPSAGC